MIRAPVFGALLLGLLELAGARADVSVLSGTMQGGPLHLVVGLVYALTFFTVVLLGPPALLAGLLLSARRAPAETRRPAPS